MFVWSMSSIMEVCKESIRTLLKESGFQNVTIEVDEDLATHRAHKRNIEKNWKWIKVMGMIITIINDELVMSRSLRKSVYCR